MLYFWILVILSSNDQLSYFLVLKLTISCYHYCPPLYLPLIVQTATPVSASSTSGRTLAPGPSLGVYRGGSLPNVSDQLLAAAAARQHQQQQQTVLLTPTQLLLQQKKIIVLTTALPQDDTTTTTMTDSISVIRDTFYCYFTPVTCIAQST